MRAQLWIPIVLSSLVSAASASQRPGDKLLEAVQTGDAARISALIDEGADLDARGDGGATALMEAVRRGDAAAVYDLLQAGADPDAEDGTGDNALRIAARKNRLAATLLLLEAEANTEGIEGQPTALTQAMVAGDDDELEALLQGGEPVTAYALVMAFRRSIRWYRTLANAWLERSVPPTVTPRKIVDVPPAYPENARVQGVQGTVTLRAEIDAQGNVIGVEVVDSIPELDRAAIEAVKQWKYEPTRLHGVPTPIEATVDVTFTLNRYGWPVVPLRLRA